MAGLFTPGANAPPRACEQPPHGGQHEAPGEQNERSDFRRAAAIQAAQEGPLVGGRRAGG